MDTSAEAARVQVEILRKMSGEERLEIAAQLRRTSLGLMEAGLRERFPNDSAETIQRRIRRIILGDPLFDLVYGSK